MGGADAPLVWVANSRPRQVSNSLPRRLDYPIPWHSCPPRARPRSAPSEHRHGTVLHCLGLSGSRPPRTGDRPTRSPTFERKGRKGERGKFRHGVFLPLSLELVPHMNEIHKLQTSSPLRFVVSQVRSLIEHRRRRDTTHSEAVLRLVRFTWFIVMPEV